MKTKATSTQPLEQTMSRTAVELLSAQKFSCSCLHIPCHQAWHQALLKVLQGLNFSVKDTEEPALQYCIVFCMPPL